MGYIYLISIKKKLGVFCDVKTQSPKLIKHETITELTASGSTVSYTSSSLIYTNRIPRPSRVRISIDMRSNDKILLAIRVSYSKNRSAFTLDVTHNYSVQYY